MTENAKKMLNKAIIELARHQGWTFGLKDSKTDKTPTVIYDTHILVSVNEDTGKIDIQVISQFHTEVLSQFASCGITRYACSSKDIIN